MHTLPSSKRISSIDILRGIVMVVMALDHVRDYFGTLGYNPTDLQRAGTALFMTRWVTHFCAPVFIFLSGTSAFLSTKKGESGSAGSGERRRQSGKLLSRGLWLIVLELTVVRLGWMFDLDYSLVFLQVIWAIGVSMVVLGALIWLPRPVILLIAMAMIFGHNLLDGYQPPASMHVVWQLLHVQGMLPYGHGNSIFVIYPLIPWVGVMAAGFCFGAIFKKEERERNKWLYGIGISAMALFVILRLINGYGDPEPWHTQPVWWRTALSFVNCSKYPPSLLYLLMTLGPAITALAVMQSGKRSAESVFARVFIVYGRVPMFYYILHIYLIHGLAVAASVVFSSGVHVSVFEHPQHGLAMVYGAWLLTVVLLYFPCRWFMHIKKSHQKWWLSYL